MNHYYTNKPEIASNPKEITYTYQRHLLTLTSDQGVFGKVRVDFGTHVLLQHFSGSPTRIIDVGCGYGIIGCALAKAYPSAFVWMVDVNERAVLLAKKNIIDNNISNATALVSNCYDKITEPADCIISNPPIRAGKKIVFEIVEGAKDRLLSGGLLWMVIQKKQGAPSLLEKMKSIFHNVTIVAKENGYWVLNSIKE